MRKSCHSESKILAILKEIDTGIPVKELTRKYGLGKFNIY
jgi:hypothetical protein